MEIVRELSLRGILGEGDFVVEFVPSVEAILELSPPLNMLMKPKLMDSIE